MQVTLHTGEERELTELGDERGVCLVFLRHLGCAFCRKQIALLKDEDLPLVFVSLSNPETTTRYREKFDAAQPFICDPEADLHERFGVKRGKLRQLFAPSIVANYVREMLTGNMSAMPVGDPYRLGAGVVVDSCLTIRYRRICPQADDLISAEELEGALASLQEC